MTSVMLSDPQRPKGEGANQEGPESDNCLNVWFILLTQTMAPDAFSLHTSREASTYSTSVPLYTFPIFILITTVKSKYHNSPNSFLCYASLSFSLHVSLCVALFINLSLSLSQRHYSWRRPVCSSVFFVCKLHYTFCFPPFKFCNFHQHQPSEKKGKLSYYICSCWCGTKKINS